MIQSPYTISLTPTGTATPIPLVTAGGWLDALPAFEASQDLFESDGVTLATAHFRPLGGVLVSITLVVETEHANHLAALDAFLEPDGGATDLLTVDGVLRFTPAGGGAATVFGQAVIQIDGSELPSGPTSTTLRTITILTILPN